MFSIEEIDKCRIQHFSKYPEIQPGDVFAFLSKSSQEMLFQVCRNSRKQIESELISATALFFHQFYLRESILDFDPRVVVVCCMNLAAKTEEYHSVSLPDLVNALPESAVFKAEVPLIEMKLLAALDFNLVVEQPWLIILYWVELFRIATGDESHAELFNKACNVMQAWQWTDAVLVFPFPQLATAAVLRAAIICNQHGSGSPDDDTSAFRILTKIHCERLPGVNVEKLLLSIETIVSRFGPNDRVAKDPAWESTAGLKKLKQLLDSSKV